MDCASLVFSFCINFTYIFKMSSKKEIQIRIFWDATEKYVAMPNYTGQCWLILPSGLWVDPSIYLKCLSSDSPASFLGLANSETSLRSNLWCHLLNKKPFWVPSSYPVLSTSSGCPKGVPSSILFKALSVYQCHRTFLDLLISLSFLPPLNCVSRTLSFPHCYPLCLVDCMAQRDIE